MPTGVGTVLSMSTTHTARQTGTQVTIGSADDLGLDDCDGETRWYTICEKHGTAIGHRTKRLAVSFGSSPMDFCEFCATPSDWCDTHEHPSASCECAWER